MYRNFKSSDPDRQSRRNTLINALFKMKALESTNEEEFNDFLLRRQLAIDAKLEASLAYRKKCPLRKSSPSPTYLYYDPDAYNQGISYQRYITNRFISSVEGGQTATDAYLRDASGTNPLGLTKCPEGNIAVVLEQRLLQRGGYQPSHREIDPYSNPPTVAVLNAYAYEFENLKPKDIQDTIVEATQKAVNNFLYTEGNTCPFLIREIELTRAQLQNNNDFEKINVGIREDKFVNNAVEDPEVINVYLHKAAYFEFVKMNLLRQMRALLISYWEAGISEELQINLTLPGMGCFARLGAKIAFSIMAHLAPVAAAAYQAAIVEFDQEQKQAIKTLSSYSSPGTKFAEIIAVQLTCPEKQDGNIHPENQAISNVFAESIQDLKIDVVKTHDFVDDKIVANRRNNLVSNGDGRAEDGNELVGLSQEAGLFENLEDAWYAASPLIRPFELLNNAKPHQTLMEFATKHMGRSETKDTGEEDDKKRKKPIDEESQSSIPQKVASILTPEEAKELQGLLEEEQLAFKPEVLGYKIELDEQNPTIQYQKKIIEELKVVSDALNSHGGMLDIYNTISAAEKNKKLSLSVKEAIDNFFDGISPESHDKNNNYYELHTLGTAGITRNSTDGDTLGYVAAFRKATNNITTGITETFQKVALICQERLSGVTHFFSEITFFGSGGRSKQAALIYPAVTAVLNGMDVLPLPQEAKEPNTLFYLIHTVTKYQKMETMKEINKIMDKLSLDIPHQKTQFYAFKKLHEIIKNNLNNSISCADVVEEALSQGGVKIILTSGNANDWYKEKEFDSIGSYNPKVSVNACGDGVHHELTIGQALSICQGVLFTDSAAGWVNSLLSKPNPAELMKDIQQMKTPPITYDRRGFRR